MARNGATGFVLVFVVLALLTELRLAFWVSLGIPISFLGAFMVMPVMDVTANFVSTFAFILVLGIVVDDAIIVGENIFRHREAHGDKLRSAIDGAREIATPVVFAVLTTVAAFSPLFFAPGESGKVAIFVPLVVVPCLLFSLVECLIILPAHLAHTGAPRDGAWRRFQQRIANGLGAVGRNVYRPGLAFALRWRYLALATGVATLVLTAGIVLGGRVAFHFFPAPEAELITASVTLPEGTPVAATSVAVSRLEAGAERLRGGLLERTGQDVFRHVYAAVGDQPMGDEGPGSDTSVDTAAPHIGQVMIELAPADERALRAEELANRWRDLTGPIPEATSLVFGTSGPTAGNDVDVMLVGSDVEQLTLAANAVKAQLRTYAGVYDIADTFQRGKEELRLGITPHAETLGLSLLDLGRQVRQAFYGEEAQRIQRGRDDIRVMVRYPSDQRRSLGNLEDMRIRTPEGGEVPFRLGGGGRAGSRLCVDKARRPAAGGQRDGGDRREHDDERHRDRRAGGPRSPRRARRAPRRALHARGRPGGAAGLPGRDPHRLHARPVRHLHAAGHPAEVIRAAAHHHERDPVRLRRRGVGDTSSWGSTCR